MNCVDLFKKNFVTVVLFAAIISLITIVPASGDDTDGDGIPDIWDNCPGPGALHPNPDQIDSYPPQRNGLGDTCDCEANFDCDQDCDGTDASKFKADFGRGSFHPDGPCTNENPCNGDFNCDGDVDGSDAGIQKADFGRSPFNNPCPNLTEGCVPYNVANWCDYCIDDDEDGYSPEGGACGLYDCDDTDYNIKPEADEICDDGIDQDCDGADLNCAIVDDDEDFWSPSINPTDPLLIGDCCEEGTESSLGCDNDTKSEIFPGASDEPGDGIDQDCDGSDNPIPSQQNYDRDKCYGDQQCTYVLGDCNNAMSTVNPDATEIDCNGIDDDCVGGDDCGITPSADPDSGYIVIEIFEADTNNPLLGATVKVHEVGDLLIMA